MFLQVQFIEAWIWKPAWGLIVLIAILFTDLLLAIYASKSFETQKATKFGVSVVAYLVTIGIAFNLGKLFVSMDIPVDPAMAMTIGDNVGKFYFAYVLLVNAASVLRHMANLGLIHRQVAAFFVKYVDIQKNRLSSREEKKDDQQQNDQLP